MRFLTLKYRAVARRLGCACPADRRETGAGANDVKPWAAASTLIGVRHALDDYTRGRILAGALSPGLAREVGSRGKRGSAINGVR